MPRLCIVSRAKTYKPLACEVAACTVTVCLEKEVRGEDFIFRTTDPSVSCSVGASRQKLCSCLGFHKDLFWDPFCFCCMQQRSLTSLYHSDCPATPMLMILCCTSACRHPNCRRLQPSWLHVSNVSSNKLKLNAEKTAATLDRNWATASQADRHSTPADKLSC